MADSTLTTPSRRTSCPISRTIQQAFDAWQTARSAYKAVEHKCQTAYERFHAMVPDRESWRRPLISDQLARIDAASKMSCLRAFDDLASDTHDVAESAFRHFLSTPPKSLADVHLQAVHLSHWLEKCSVEQPVLDWLEALTTTNHAQKKTAPRRGQNHDQRKNPMTKTNSGHRMKKNNRPATNAERSALDWESLDTDQVINRDQAIDSAQNIGERCAAMINSKTKTDLIACVEAFNNDDAHHLIDLLLCAEQSLEFRLTLVRCALARLTVAGTAISANGEGDNA